MARKVWVYVWRDDEWCEHEVQLFTSKRKANKVMHDDAEEVMGKKWRSIKEEDKCGIKVVKEKEDDRFVVEKQGIYTLSGIVCQMEVK